MLGVLVLLLLLGFSQASKVDPRVWEDTEDGKTGSFSVYLNDRADLRMTKEVKSDPTSKGWFVLNALKAQASLSQAPILRLLEERQDVERIVPFYIANFLIVDAKRSVVELLEKLPQVNSINSNRPFKVPLEQADSPAFPKREEREANEWNIEYVKAHLIWQRYGTQGVGIIANADTGVDYTHPALTPNYKGNENNGTHAFNHNYNWWDGVKRAALPGTGKCGINGQFPCDDNGHGTHTTGTAVGQDGIGVAPGSRWIACRNMDRGFGTVESYMSCLQFFLAPTNLEGKNPDPSQRPLSIGNSYGCVSSEGCRGREFEDAVLALRAAGVFMSVSAGNSGPSCSTITDPPATESSVISVGATGLRSDSIAAYSSRGPVSGSKKPTIVAPGSSVRSCIPGGGFASYSGTSMASPHPNGAVSLLVGVCPSLAYDVDALEDLMIKSARRLYTTQGCGGDTGTTTPNNVFGHGMLDLQAAASLCSSL